VLLPEERDLLQPLGPLHVIHLLLLRLQPHLQHKNN
jgi:hypothetical protein